MNHNKRVIFDHHLETTKQKAKL